MTSAPHDSAVGLWDIMRGAVLQTPEGYTDGINAVILQPNGKMWRPHRTTTVGLRLWEAAMDAVLQMLEGYRGNVGVLTVSLNGMTLAFALKDTDTRGSYARCQRSGRFTGR
jgi:hypothetical protein